MEDNFFKDLKDSIRDAADKAGDKLNEWKERTKDWVDNAGDNAERTADRTGDRLENVSDRVGDEARDTWHDTKRAADRAGDRLEDAADRVGDEARDTWHDTRRTADRATDNIGWDLDNTRSSDQDIANASTGGYLGAAAGLSALGDEARDRDSDYNSRQNVGNTYGTTGSSSSTPHAGSQSDRYDTERHQDDDNVATRGTLGMSAGLSALGDETRDRDSHYGSRENMSSDYGSGSSSSSSSYGSSSDRYDSDRGSDYESGATRGTLGMSAGLDALGDEARDAQENLRDTYRDRREDVSYNQSSLGETGGSDWAHDTGTDDADKHNAATRGTLGFSAGMSALGDETRRDRDDDNDRFGSSSSRQNVGYDRSNTADDAYNNNIRSVSDRDDDSDRGDINPDNDYLNDRHTQNRIDDL